MGTLHGAGSTSGCVGSSRPFNWPRSEAEHSAADAWKILSARACCARALPRFIFLARPSAWRSPGWMSQRGGSAAGLIVFPSDPAGSGAAGADRSSRDRACCNVQRQADCEGELGSARDAVDDHRRCAGEEAGAPAKEAPEKQTQKPGAHLGNWRKRSSIGRPILRLIPSARVAPAPADHFTLRALDRLARRLEAVGRPFIAIPSLTPRPGFRH
jgi:hypothetical protein